MRHPNQRQYHLALPAKCAVLRERSSGAHPINELRWATIALLLLATLLTGCADVMDLDDAPDLDVGPAQIQPLDRADPTADDAEPDGRSQAGATQVVRADTEPSLRDDPADDPAEAPAVGVTATPGLDPGLQLTATAIWQGMMATAPPPPPVTGGAGPGEGYQGDSRQFAQEGLAGAWQAPAQAAPWLQQSAEPNRESYAAIEDNPFLAVIGQDPLSTFSIDVDTASYCQRAAVPAATAGCRRRTRCASRSWSTTSPTTTRAPDGRPHPFSRRRARWPAAPGSRSTGWCASA